MHLFEAAPNYFPRKSVEPRTTSSKANFKVQTLHDCQPQGKKQWHSRKKKEKKENLVGFRNPQIMGVTPHCDIIMVDTINIPCT